MAIFDPEHDVSKFQSQIDTLVKLRQDALRCKPGNKPCGGRCIPQEQKCKEQGGSGKGSGLAKSIGTGLAVGAIAGGAIGAAALANRGKSSNNNAKIAAGVAATGAAAYAANKYRKKSTPEAKTPNKPPTPKAKTPNKPPTPKAKTPNKPPTPEAKTPNKPPTQKSGKPNFKSDNPYEVLGIDGNASASEIKEKYKNLANEFHPDKGGNSDQMAKINEAYSRAKKFAKGDSLLSRVDSFLLARITKIDSAYTLIQQDFPHIPSRFWYQ